jgi:hypothetical protein
VNRRSEAGFTVCVVEAGPKDTNPLQVPDLELRFRAGSRYEQPQLLPATRSGPWRIQLDQWPKLRARSGGRLRSRGAGRQPRVARPRDPALFRAARATYRGWRRALPRAGRRTSYHLDCIIRLAMPSLTRQASLLGIPITTARSRTAPAFSSARSPRAIVSVRHAPYRACQTVALISPAGDRTKQPARPRSAAWHCRVDVLSAKRRHSDILPRVRTDETSVQTPHIPSR